MSTRGYYLLGIVAEQRLEFKTAAEYFTKVTNWPSTPLAVGKSRKLNWNNSIQFGKPLAQRKSCSGLLFYIQNLYFFGVEHAS